MKTIEIENKKGKVKLNEVVTRESIGRMIDEIGRLFGASASACGADFGEIMNAAENAIDVLDIEINSPGGSVFDGYTIFQEIKSLQDRGVTVNATITGMAASMASVICMACDKVSIVPHGRMMIHNASNAVAGDAAQLRKVADLLETVSNDLADIYAYKTKLDVDKVKSMMDKETWMTAIEAVNYGFVDELTNRKGLSAVETAAKVDSQTINSHSDMFLTNKAATEKITGLESRIAELETDITSASETITSLQGESATFAENIASITSERDKLATELTAAQATITDHESVVTAANEKLSKFDDEVAAKVLIGIANKGFTGVIPESNLESETNEPITIAEFNKLSPAARMSYVKNGGKLK